MAASLNSIPYLLLLMASTAWSDPIDIIFHGFDGTSNNLTLDGAAHVTAEGVLQLTNFTHKVIGHAFYYSPVRMLLVNNSVASKPAAVSFSTSFVFDIVNSAKGGEGFAFVVAPSTTIQGASCCRFLGLLGKHNDGNSSNHVFAVEFDTYQNGANGSSYSDMHENHVGVDVNSVASILSEPAAYNQDGGSNVSLSLDGGKPIQAWIDYSGETKVLNVTISPLTAASKPPKPLISRVVNLSSVINEFMYVGFSSSTGENVSSSHCIMGWSFSTNGTARPLDVSRLPYPRRASPRSRLSRLEGGLIATASSDVYSYGVLLLEVACGQKPVEPSASGKQSFLFERVKECQRQGQLLQFVDPRLEGCYVPEEVELVLTLGLQCCRSDAELRPTMRQVAHRLNGDDKFRDGVSIALSDADSFDVASGPSYSITSFGTSCKMSASGSFPGCGNKLCLGEN